MKRAIEASRRHAAALAACVALALAAVPALVHAQEEAAVVKRASELREAPGDTGRVLQPLPAATALTRTGERQGPWVHVRTAAGTAGWVHLFDIGPATGGGTASGGNVLSGALRGVQGLFAKPADRPLTTATSTIGIRGLGAEDIANAQPDPAAVARMEALRVSDADARGFAQTAAWQPVPVDPLPAPAPVRGTAAPGKENAP